MFDEDTICNEAGVRSDFDDSSTTTTLHEEEEGVLGDNQEPPIPTLSSLSSVHCVTVDTTLQISRKQMDIYSVFGIAGNSRMMVDAKLNASEYTMEEYYAKDIHSFGEKATDETLKDVFNWIPHVMSTGIESEFKECDEKVALASRLLCRNMKKRDLKFIQGMISGARLMVLYDHLNKRTQREFTLMEREEQEKKKKRINKKEPIIVE
jgi:hypothetical protein